MMSFTTIFIISSFLIVADACAEDPSGRQKSAENDIAPRSGAPAPGTLVQRYSPSPNIIGIARKGAGQRGQVHYIDDDYLGGGVKSGYVFNMGRGNTDFDDAYYDWTPDTPATPINKERPVAQDRPKKDNDDDK